METNTMSVASELAPVSTAEESRHSRRSRWRQLSRLLTPYLFVLPFLLLFAAFFLAPFAYAISQSVYRAHRSGLGFAPPTIVWAGAYNYLQALHDPDFWQSVLRVLIFGAVQIPIEMILAVILAFLMDSAVIRFRRFFRLAIFIPYAVPGVVAAIMWGYVYTPGSSPIISILMALHLGAPNFFDKNTVLWSIANIATWEFTGFNMVIMYSALQSVPQEIYESGRLDGLSEIGVALKLKLPMIRPALLLALMFAIIGAFQLFNEPTILNRMSTAITTTYTPNIYAYNVAFVNTDYYYGGALTVILGILTFLLSYGLVRYTQRQSGV